MGEEISNEIFSESTQSLASIPKKPKVYQVSFVKNCLNSNFGLFANCFFFFVSFNMLPCLELTNTVKDRSHPGVGGTEC